MPLHASYIEDEDRLDLTFDGNLDLSISVEICRICQRVTTELRICVVDLSGVDRVFDSGVALLRMLCRRLRELGATVVLLGDHPAIESHLSYITHAVEQRPQLSLS